MFCDVEVSPCVLLYIHHQIRAYSCKFEAYLKAQIHVSDDGESQREVWVKRSLNVSFMPSYHVVSL